MLPRAIHPSSLLLLSFLFSSLIHTMSESKPRDNPYLAHLPPSQRGAGTGSNATTKEPLYGFLPRKVNGEQVRKAMVCTIHILNGKGLIFWSGWRCQPIHEATTFWAVQEDLGDTKETASIYADGRVSEDCE